jgi:hypothetical protein
MCGNLQGIFAICREFSSEWRWKERQDQAVTAKIPYARIREFFASDQGFLEGRAANLPNREIAAALNFWPQSLDGRDR